MPEVPAQDLLSIKDASEFLGVSKSSLRRYESEGLIESKRDVKSGYRFYERSQVEKLKSHLSDNSVERKFDIAKKRAGQSALFKEYLDKYDPKKNEGLVAFIPGPTNRGSKSLFSNVTKRAVYAYIVGMLFILVSGFVGAFQLLNAFLGKEMKISKKK
jgi:predicted site-specific integrase-resolvase